MLYISCFSCGGGGVVIMVVKEHFVIYTDTMESLVTAQSRCNVHSYTDRDRCKMYIHIS